VTSTPSSTEQQRRLRAAPVGLLLLFWGLGLGPLAHAVIAHGEPLLHESGDGGWVQHASPAHRPSRRDAAPASHQHAPGALEHLQLAMASAPATLALVAVLLLLAVTGVAAWRAPVLPRWRLPEVPGAP